MHETAELIIEVTQAGLCLDRAGPLDGYRPYHLTTCMTMTLGQPPALPETEGICEAESLVPCVVPSLCLIPPDTKYRVLLSLIVVNEGPSFHPS